MFQSPTIAEKDLERFYSETYPILYERRDSAKLFDVQERRAADFSRYIADHVDAPAKVLEIGCSAGYLGRAIISMFPGVTYQGVELDETLADVASRHFPVAKVIDELDSKFDLILMSHVLEHMFDPVDYMRRLGHLLAPNGSIVIEVPNGNAACGFEVAHPFIFTTRSLAEIGRRAEVSMIHVLEHNSFKGPGRRAGYLSAVFSNGAVPAPITKWASLSTLRRQVAGASGRKMLIRNLSALIVGYPLRVAV